MSKPNNKLDEFITYTYHFELHVAKTWLQIFALRNTDKNLHTKSTSPNDTLVINTRKDAHQTIQDVKFGYIGPSVNNYGMYSPDGTMTFNIIEPNRVNFIEKLSNIMKNHNVQSLGSLHWALKIFFVGRTNENNIKTVPLKGILIPIAFKDFDATFTNKGGEYHMDFITTSSFASSTELASESAVLLAGYCNKAISVSAKTVKGALIELQQKLNDNYKKTYEVELQKPKNVRGLVYKINIDKDLEDGNIDYIPSKDSTQQGSNTTITFSSSETILTWIFQILRSSNKLNAMVSYSKDMLRNEKSYPRVKFISVYPSYTLDESNMIITFNIYLFKGEDSPIQGLKNSSGSSYGNLLEFDFMFGPSGENIDVIGFDIHMKSALAWFSNLSTNSSDANTGLSASGKTSKVSTDVANKTPKIVTIDRIALPIKDGFDIGYLPSVTSTDKTGQINRGEGQSIKTAKLMFDTVAEMHGAFDPQFTMTIRGNIDLLEAGVCYPLSDLGLIDEVPFGVRGPLWIKVHIKSPDDETGAYHDFFYKGKYNVISIENHFVDGKFLQVINMIMMGGLDLDYSKQILNAIAADPNAFNIKSKEPIITPPTTQINTPTTIRIPSIKYSPTPKNDYYKPGRTL